MNTPEMTGSLMFFTIGAVLIIAFATLLWFFRKPKNTHPRGVLQPLEPSWQGNAKKAKRTS